MTKQHDSADHLIPPDPTLSSLKDAAADCQACDLYKNATQTVFGLGLGSAKMMLIGEQPGNDEDLTGKPFVGPAGLLLDTRQRGQFINSPLAEKVMATVHPSSILRAPDEAARKSQMDEFIADLKVAARALSNLE